jgi:hypothetical protein
VKSLGLIYDDTGASTTFLPQVSVSRDPILQGILHQVTVYHNSDYDGVSHPSGLWTTFKIFDAERN